MTLSRAEPGSRRLRCDVIDLAKAAEDVLGAQAEEALRRGIDIGLKEASPIRVAGDGTMLGEMLVNLVDNAIRYTPVGGKVKVSVTRLDGRALFTVEDNGPGIHPMERKHVFERFYRVMGTQEEGGGLGLAIVREVIQGAGGTAYLSDAAGGGPVGYPAIADPGDAVRARERIGCLPETSLCATRLACSEPPRQCNRTITYKQLRRQNVGPKSSCRWTSST
ncbi:MULTISPECIES: HAMP domain-containing sensor histidine kinase [unclassified Rhizobium]|uniref:sensor histidine kinase n=1 Tax=Rhizobium sp. BK399 TaxID=2587063 RepID=UPI00180BB167|nr:MULTISPECIES: HAMP domain-containing sensor histidine kinase [unclassified Rhizobium]MBB3317547.1 signal transduction histidine kinase [Rhizobium sp. BK181]MBB3543285.1 signal transduction histidine kinase [Rhizobium sp. BK399]MCS3741703.1 signal transduction histidine kinase [Rhizobium sp. BK661]